MDAGGLASGMRPLFVLCAVSTLAVAGCASTDNDTMNVEWMDTSHAQMVMKHGGGHGDMMTRMAGMSMTGPSGGVPMHMWNGTGTCSMGQMSSCPMHGTMQGWMMESGTHTLEMHAMMVDGTAAMVMVPPGEAGPVHEHQAMQEGDYVWKMDGMGDGHAHLG